MIKRRGRWGNDDERGNDGFAGISPHARLTEERRLQFENELLVDRVATMLSLYSDDQQVTLGRFGGILRYTDWCD